MAWNLPSSLSICCQEVNGQDLVEYVQVQVENASLEGQYHVSKEHLDAIIQDSDNNNKTTTTATTTTTGTTTITTTATTTSAQRACSLSTSMDATTAVERGSSGCSGILSEEPPAWLELYSNFDNSDTESMSAASALEDEGADGALQDWSGKKSLYVAMLDTSVAHLGLELDVSDQRIPVVMSVRPKGAAASWNAACLARYLVKAGDYIVKVNGQAGSTADITERLQKATSGGKLELTMKRPQLLHVSVKKAHSKKLGLQLKQSSTGLLVTDIMDGVCKDSLVPIRISDRIVAVNGCEGSTAELLELIHGADDLELRILSYV